MTGHGGFFGQHVGHEDVQPGDGKKPQGEPIHRQHSEADVNHDLAKVVRIPGMCKKSGRNELAWTFQTQLHVLLQVRTVVVEHTDDVKPQANSKDPGLIALAKPGKIAVVRDQAQHGAVVQPQGVDENAGSPQKASGSLPAWVSIVDVLVDPQKPIRPMADQQGAGSGTPDLFQAQVPGKVPQHGEVHWGHQKLVQIDDLPHREGSGDLTTVGSRHVHVCEVPDEADNRMGLRLAVGFLQQWRRHGAPRIESWQELEAEPRLEPSHRLPKLPMGGIRMEQRWPWVHQD